MWDLKLATASLRSTSRFNSRVAQGQQSHVLTYLPINVIAWNRHKTTIAAGICDARGRVGVASCNVPSFEPVTERRNPNPREHENHQTPQLVVRVRWLPTILSHALTFQTSGTKVLKPILVVPVCIIDEANSLW